MEFIALVKSIVSIMGKARTYSRKTDKKVAKSKKRKKIFGARQIFFIVMLFAGVYILWSSFFEQPSTTGKTQQTSLSSVLSQEITSYSTIINNANKISTLSNNASSALTMYPDKTTQALSSSTVDEETGSQRYTHFVGKGGVALSNKSNVVAATCPQPAPIRYLKYINTIFKSFICKNITNDFLTSQSGILFTFPPYLTTSSGAIQGIVYDVRNVAWLFLVPIIALIGISFMTKFGNTNYAEALDSLPRLILSLVGVTMCLFIAQQILQFGDVMMQGLWAIIQREGTNLVDINDMIMPVTVWNGWLDYLLAIGISLLVGQALAPLAILGNVFGTFIAIGLYAAIQALVIIDAPNFVILSFSLALGAQLIIRIILIDFYITMSPFAMIALGLPGQTGVRFARDWVYGFVSLILSQIAQVVVLGIGMVVLSEYGAHYGETDDIIGDFIKFGTLGLMLRVSSLFKSDASGLVQQLGPLVGSSIQKARTIFFP